MEKITLQEYAHQVIAPEFRQPLKSAQQVCELQGWGSPDEPYCCGLRLTVKSFIGLPYYAECPTCHKFIAAADGPSFGNASVSFPDGDKIDLETDYRWIVGVAPSEAA